MKMIMQSSLDTIGTPYRARQSLGMTGIITKLLVLSSLAVIGCEARIYTDTTIEVAESLNFPAVQYNLRANVQRFLRQVSVEMRLDVQELRAKNQMNRATELENLNEQRLMDLEERFDREFERVDRKLLAGAERLDEEEAPSKTKAAFVKEVQADAERSIGALVESFGRKYIKNIKKPLTSSSVNFYYENVGKNTHSIKR